MHFISDTKCHCRKIANGKLTDQYSSGQVTWSGASVGSSTSGGFRQALSQLLFVALEMLVLKSTKNKLQLLVICPTTIGVEFYCLVILVMIYIAYSGPSG